MYTSIEKSQKRKEMNFYQIIELIKVITPVLWLFLTLFLVILLYRPFRDQLLPNPVGFKAMGVEFSFIRDSIDAAIELVEKSPQWKVDVPEKDRDRVLNRAKSLLKILNGTRILWVDDHPENNINERRMFRQLKAEVDIAKSTDEGLRLLKADRYDLVISGMSRGSGATAGLGFLY